MEVLSKSLEAADVPFSRRAARNSALSRWHRPEIPIARAPGAGFAPAARSRNRTSARIEAAVSRRCDFVGPSAHDPAERLD
jgi:hypothetical protein